MQTFLPYQNFVNSAKVLDSRRLGKQRIEVKQILAALAGESKGWVNHPATVMWRGHERCLIEYGIAICEEWQDRGYVDNTEPKITAYSNKFKVVTLQPPKWLGMRKFHSSHRSNLLRKDPQHYRQFGWRENDDLPYFWPGEMK